MPPFDHVPAPLPPLPVVPGRPWIIGHRGAPARAPENSLAGFARALDDGADAIELDVHRSRDGEIVVVHDPALPDGRCVADLTWAEIRAAGTAAPVPRLSAVLELVGERAAVFVELKGAGTAAPVVELLRRSRTRSAIHAFDHREVRAVRTLDPARSTGVLLASYLVDTVGAMRAAGASTLWQHASLIDAALVASVRSAGGLVIAWTVNEPAELRRLAALGVTGLCTDDPARTRAVLDGAA